MGTNQSPPHCQPSKRNTFLARKLNIGESTSPIQDTCNTWHSPALAR